MQCLIPVFTSLTTHPTHSSMYLLILHSLMLPYCSYSPLHSLLSTTCSLPTPHFSHPHLPSSQFTTHPHQPFPLSFHLPLAIIFPTPPLTPLVIFLPIYYYSPVHPPFISLTPTCYSPPNSLLTPPTHPHQPLP